MMEQTSKKFSNQKTYPCFNSGNYNNLSSK